MTAELHQTLPPRNQPRVGEYLRRWRARRGWSQLRVAVHCNVSARHLCFVETGRAHPSRALIIHLARSLGATNEELNGCLLACGYAPQHVIDLGVAESALSATVDEMIGRHDPYPAFMFNADWVMERLNSGGQWLCSVLMPDLWANVADPRAGVDMVAALIHSEGLFSHMHDAASVGWALLRQLRVEQLTNPGLQARVDQLELTLRDRFPDYLDDEPVRADPSRHLDFDTVHGPLSFFMLQSVVGIPQQITIVTPRVELWFPADSYTREVLERSAPALG